VHLIHGSALAPVDDSLGKTGNALHACERATRQLSALSPQLHTVPAEAEAGEVALRAKMLPVEKLDLIEGPSRRAEEQNEPKAIGQIGVATEIDARIGHG
jgi:hypothetical protein